MSKAEDYIRKNTKHFSNKWYDDLSQGYVPWLTPDQAREAAEIAREEIYEWLSKNIYMYNGQCENDRIAIIEDLKQAMKGE
jgi:hypothetical protein